MIVDLKNNNTIIMNINIVYNKEMRALINRIKNYGLKNSGIIFGGLVRSDIIGGHYRKEYFKKTDDYTKYWDEEYDIETIKRTYIPNDMDIYFKNKDAVNNFITDITNLVKSFNGYINITRNNNKNLKYLFKYDKLSHTKVYFEFRIGNTFVYSGIKLKFTIDIIHNNDNSDNTFQCIEPPFNNLDFLSNIFLMEKVNNMTIIRISNCSGTPIDEMNYIDKTRISLKIMDDIINYRTQFVRDLITINTENINCFRIIKMLEYGWNITNLPFKIMYISDINDKEDLSNDNCCICLDKIKDDEFKSDEKIFEINTNIHKSYKVHHKCFINYLKIEQRKYYINTTTGISECRCPFRNPFNFKDCYKLVSYDI